MPECEAGLNPVTDAILREDPKGPYVNVIAVRSQDKDKPWVKTLAEAYRSPEVRRFVEDKFKGAVRVSTKSWSIFERSGNRFA